MNISNFSFDFKNEHNNRVFILMKGQFQSIGFTNSILTFTIHHPIYSPLISIIIWVSPTLEFRPNIDVVLDAVYDISRGMLVRNWFLQAVTPGTEFKSLVPMDNPDSSLPLINQNKLIRFKIIKTIFEIVQIPVER
jgi:hypothetical protein